MQCARKPPPLEVSTFKYELSMSQKCVKRAMTVMFYGFYPPWDPLKSNRCQIYMISHFNQTSPFQRCCFHKIRGLNTKTSHVIPEKNIGIMR